MVKRRSTASLQKAVDFCPDNGDEDVIDKEMLQESQ